MVMHMLVHAGAADVIRQLAVVKTSEEHVHG